MQPVSRLFSSSCFSLKSSSLSVDHVVVAVKVNGCKKARFGGRDSILIWIKNRQVVRHLNAFFQV